MSSQLKHPTSKIVSQDQALEFLKCRRDHMYFIENYVKINNPDYGLIIFKPHDYQKKLLDNIHNNRYNIAMMCRQSGKTTAVVAYILYYIIFNKGKKVTICAHKEPMSRNILAKVKIAYKNLPSWMQHKIVKSTTTILELDNESSVTAEPTSKEGTRGVTNNLLLLDEFAFVEPHIAEEFWTAVYPTIAASKSSKIIVISTPNGLNKFHKIWRDSKINKNEFIRTFINWRSVPNYDKRWHKETLANMGLRQFTQEFECEFVGSVATLVSAKKLQEMQTVNPIKSSNGLDIFEKPIDGHNYIITVDPSSFIFKEDNTQDYAAFVIFDVTKVPYKVVAKYRSKTITYNTFPELICKIAQQYNYAHILCECRDGTGIGKLIHDLEYENILMCRTTGRKNGDGQILGQRFGANRSTYGVIMSQKVKTEGCDILKTIVEENKLIFNDNDIVNEFITFNPKNNSWGAAPGSNDDLVMCLVSFAWMTAQDFFKDLTNTDLRTIDIKQEKEIDETLISVGFFDNKIDTDKFEVIDGLVWEIQEEEGVFNGFF